MFPEPILYDGLIYTAGFALIITVSVLINPRIWLQDFPDNLQSDVPPKSPGENRQTFVTGFFFALFIVGYPLYSVSRHLSFPGVAYEFSTVFLYSFILMMICNILYWIFLDILIFNLIIGRIRTVPGLKKKFKFGGWKRQFFGMFVGVLSCLFISLIVSWTAGFFLN